MSRNMVTRRLAIHVLPAFLFSVTSTFAQTAPSQNTTQDTPTGTKVDASRGGITISSGVNSLTIGARAQFRWTLDDREDFDSDTGGRGIGEADGALSQFDVPRLRLTLSGGVFRPWMKYSFQFDFSRTPGEGASKIKDAILEIRPVGRAYRVAFGQFKAPFGLQQLTSSGRLQFVDRAITDAKFNPSRDMGVMVAGTIAARKVGYDVGVFNGSGESVRQNNRSHLWAARVYYNPLGPYALSEGASDAGEKGALHVGAGVRGGKQIRGRTAAGIVESADNQHAWNVEFAYKRPRFFSTVEYFWMTDEQNNPVALRDIDSRGYHAQAGFMPVAKTIEVGVLVAQIDGDTRVDDAGVSEVRGVVGYYWQAHNLKLQADVGRIGYDRNFSSLSSRARQGLPALGTRLRTGSDFGDTQIRVQLQLAF
jgi:phosphate-selective porin